MVFFLLGSNHGTPSPVADCQPLVLSDEDRQPLTFDDTFFERPESWPLCLANLRIFKSTSAEDLKVKARSKVNCKRWRIQEMRSQIRVNTDALWLITAKNTDRSTGPLARPFARSLAPLTRLLAPDCSLRLCPPLRLLACSLAHFAHSLAHGKVNY